MQQLQKKKEIVKNLYISKCIKNLPRWKFWGQTKRDGWGKNGVG
jgi:hypothetical protein